MRHLLRFLAWRPAKRRPGRALLGATSVALGVALFVSADVSTHTVLRAFERTLDRLSGKARLQVSAASGAGVPESVLARVEKAAPGALAAPVLQRSTSLTELVDGPVLVFGVDFSRDRQLRVYDVPADPASTKAFVATALTPGGVLVTGRFASRHKLAPGSTFQVDALPGKSTLKVTGILADDGPASVFGGNLLLVALPTAQRLFGRAGEVDRLDIAPPPGAEVESVRATLATALGPEYSVGPLKRRSAVLEDALSRVRALVIVSVVALIVGIFIIYNSVSISVVERLRDLAVLRSIGATRGQLLATVLVEWLLVGLAGSAAGVAGGAALATALVKLAARSANTLSLTIDVTGMDFPWTTAAWSLAAGTLVSLLAAWAPAREAMSIAPVALFRESAWNRRQRPRHVKAFVLGLLLMGIGALVVFVFFLRMPEYGGLAATVLVFVGVALALPQATVWVAAASRGLLGRCFGLEGTLAADHAANHPQRTGLTVVALGGALSMMVASATFLYSLKTSADRWMDEAFPFDLSVNGTDLSRQLYSPVRFPESLAAEVAAVPGVRAVYTVSVHQQPYRDHEVMLLGIDIEGLYAMHSEKGLPERMGPLAEEPVRRSLIEGRGIIVSQNFAHRYSAFPGATVELQTADGPKRFEVLEAVEDYSWPSGTIVTDRGVYKKHWRDERLAYVDLSVRPGVPVAEVRSRLAKVLAPTTTAFLYAPADLRKIGNDALDQAFQLSNVQVVIAIGIGFLGILNTLLISVLRRTREIGLLRAIGATRPQVGRVVVVEALLLAVAGGAMGVLAGLLGAALPLRLHTLQVTGYWIPLHVPWGTLGLAFVAALAIGAAASAIPARRASRLNVLDAIAYE